MARQTRCRTSRCGGEFNVAVKKKMLRRGFLGCGLEFNDAVKIFVLRRRKIHCGGDF
jgi:hypothetical protein